MSSIRLPILTMMLVFLAALPATAEEPSLQMLDGHVDLAGLKGKVVYLDFWASWCAPCQKSFPWMAELQKAHADDGLVILAVNVDRKDGPADKFLEGRDVPFTIVRDPEGELAGRFDLKAMPTAFVFGRDGTFVGRHEGFRNEDADEVAAQVAALLEADGKDSR